jgi:hypothetical protein
MTVFAKAALFICRSLRFVDFDKAGDFGRRALARQGCFVTAGCFFDGLKADLHVIGFGVIGVLTA